MPALRTFLCKTCAQQFSTDMLGRFTTCPPCKEAAARAKRTKVCAYRHCDESFYDDTPKSSQRYHSDQCSHREKAFRSGKAQDETYFRQTRDPSGLVEWSCILCSKPFSQPPSEKRNRCTGCLDALRNKTCRKCGEPYVDSSTKNTRRYCEACAKPAARKLKPLSKRAQSQLTRYREVAVLSGGSRIDDIRTLTKATHTWWGRVSELIYAACRPAAVDIVATQGTKSPFDFRDPSYGRVNVRGAQSRRTGHGKLSWQLPTSGLGESCDYVFFVAYHEGCVTHLWGFEAGSLNDHLMVLTPESREYRYGAWAKPWEDLLPRANEVLVELLALPDPGGLPEGERYAWMDDPRNLTRSSGGRGRRAEILYKGRYPDSVDLNRLHGPHWPYDFDDPAGTRVNVKSCRRKERSDRPGSFKWSFSILNNAQAVKGHQCDLYSCLALDSAGGRILHEFRIPAEVIGKRQVLHVPDPFGGTQWAPYVVKVLAFMVVPPRNP